MIKGRRKKNGVWKISDGDNYNESRTKVKSKEICGEKISDTVSFLVSMTHAKLQKMTNDSEQPMKKTWNKKLQKSH